MAPYRGYGITIPFDRAPLHAQQERISELADLGYTDAWSAETDGTDAFTPLVLTSQWAPSLRLGTAIVPVFTRGPAVIAQSALAMAQAAPGRFVLGLGTSSDVIVGRWNGIEFDEPYKRVRDTVRFVRAQAKFAIAAYLNVPVYAAFHEWLGRGPQLQGMWDAWKAGDRAAALEAIPDEVVDQLIVHGSHAQCRAHIQRYIDNGVTTPALAVLGMAGVDTEQAVRELTPR